MTEIEQLRIPMLVEAIILFHFRGGGVVLSLW